MIVLNHVINAIYKLKSEAFKKCKNHERLIQAEVFSFRINLTGQSLYTVIV